MSLEQVIISNPALPQPVALFTDPDTITFAIKEDEVGKEQAFDRNLLPLFKKDEKFMGMIKSFASNLSAEEDWVLEKFIKIIMFLDKTARKLFTRTDLNEENFADYFEKYLSRYRTPVEANYVPSSMAANVFATLSRVRNFSESQFVDETLLSYVFPMSPDDQER